VLLFIVALLLALFAPSILSTQFGKHALLRILRSMSGYEIHAGELNLQWMKGQTVRQIEVIDHNGRSLFRADSITSTAPLWKLLLYHDVGHLQIEAPFTVIEPPQQLAARLVVHQAALLPMASITPKMNILGEISVSQGALDFIQPGLETLSMKEISLEAALLPKSIKLKSSGTTEESAQQGTFQIDLLAYPGSNQIDAAVGLTDFPLRAADGLVSILYPDLKGVIRETIGESMNAELKLKNMQESLQLHLKATSELFSANLETKIQDDTLELVSPALFQFQIPPKSFEKLTSLSTKNGVSAQLKIDELSIPLQNHEQLKIQGTLKSSGLQFDDWTVEPFSLYAGSPSLIQGEWSVKIDSPQVQLQGILNLPEKWENLSFTGEALLPKNTKVDFSLKFLELGGSIKGVLEVPAFQMGNTPVGATSFQFAGSLKTKAGHFSLTSTVNEGPLTASGTFAYPQDLKMQGSCSQLPIETLQPFLADLPLASLIGETFTTSFQLNLSRNARLLHLSTASAHLTLKASLSQRDQQLDLLEPASFVWTLTPQGYVALSQWLQGSAAYALSEPATFKGNINSLSFSSDQVLNSLKYEGQITSDALSFKSGAQTNKVSQVRVSLSHLAAAAPHQFQISANASPPGTLSGTLSCKGNWTPPGTAEIKLLLEQFPAATFDLFAAPFSTFSLSTLCGPTLNLSLNTTLNAWNGPFELEIHSAGLRSSLKGLLSQGTLTLTDTFHLQLDVTRQLSEMFFRSMNPLDVTSVRSEGPVTLEIGKQGFSYPLFPPNAAQIQIGAGRLELGKLLCHNEGNIQATMGLLKLGQYRPGDELELWFAPLDFQIQNGLLNCDRTEILIAKDFQVCTWGTVNLPGNSIDGILGLTSSCLKNAFGIGNLPENYVLQIPIRGSLTDVKIDKGKATTRIGALMLWQQKGSVGGIVKGPAGKLLGEALGKLGPLPGGDQKAPPPKKPFPWDKEPTSPKKKTSDAPVERKALIRPDDSALKQLLKLSR
jgi:hypothetical protein